jgi:hypothetical protein
MVGALEPIASTASKEKWSIGHAGTARVERNDGKLQMVLFQRNF